MSRSAGRKRPAIDTLDQRDVASKRESILDAATSLFAGRDISLVTMEEVAARAGVAKGTLYNHFSSKDDLYYSILTARMGHLCEAIRGVLEEEEDAAFGLRKYVVHTMMFLLKYPDFFRLLRREGTSPRTNASAEVRNMRAELRGILRGFLARGMTDGSMRVIPLDLVTDALLGAIEGAAVRCSEEGGASQRGLAEAESVFDLLWRSLTADPGAGPTASKAGLGGAQILVTREEGPDGALGKEIEKVGGVVLRFPFLRHVPPEDPSRLRDAVARARGYDWILFSSARAVEAFHRAGGTGVACRGVRIGAVGDATAEAARTKIGWCDLAAERSSGAGLASALRDVAGGVTGKRVLLPRADEARPDLLRILLSEGAEVDEVIAYRTVAADGDTRSVALALSGGQIDAVVFSSGSAARVFAARLGEEFFGAGRRPRVISIGPSTSETLRQVGISPDEEAASPSWREVALAVVRAVRGGARPGAAPNKEGAHSHEVKGGSGQ